MTKAATFQYQRRRCGQVFDGKSSGKPFVSQMLLTAVINTVLSKGKNLNEPPMLQVHSCNDGGEGVADLIGFREGDGFDKK